MTEHPTTDDLRSWLRALPHLPEHVPAAERIDRLRLLEEVKAAAAAAQAVEAAALDRQRRAEPAAAGLPLRKQGAGLAGEIGLALRMSPARAQRWLGWAKIVTTELPATFAALRDGRTTEWRATILARETIFLSREHRGRVDRELAPHLEDWGDKRTGDEARRAAYRLDPSGAVERARAAAADRHVTIRPAPDTMCRLSALLPVTEGVAAYAALRAAADSAAASGDDRSRGQVMADTLVDRVTGRATTGAVPIELNLIMTDQALLGTGPQRDEPAHLLGHGPLPAGIARSLAGATDAPRWLRRLYTDPLRGSLRDGDARRRRFTAAQSHLLRVRDQSCRTPSCDAPIRHLDHAHRHSDGGPTDVDNGQGLSESCNHTKEAPGWSTRAAPDGTITTTTPTGHSYVSRPPAPPGTAPPLTRSVEFVYARGRPHAA